MIADYASVILDARRQLDSRATIAAVERLHANTYFYLVHSVADWNTMRDEFLPAASKAGLDVWLYFVPPSECPETCSLPFEKDYIRIAAETAKLGLTYPNLKGLAIDDFAYNVALYTPEYIGRLREAGRAVNPKFQFFPLLYWRSMTAEFLDRYSRVIDGVIFAYRDEPTINTSRNSTLREQLDRAEALMRDRGLALVLMIYCAPLGRIPIPPSVEYVRNSVAMGVEDVRRGRLAGVVTYKLDKSGRPAPAAENYAASGNGRATMLVSGANMEAGGYAELSCPATAERAALTFQRTAFYTRVPAGYLFLQVLADDRVAWEQDVASIESKTWKPERIELGPVRGRLRLRLALKRKAGSLQAIAGFDGLVAEGFTLADPGFENSAAWAAAQTGPAFMPMVQIYDPGRPVRMFNAVRAVYK